MPMNKLNNLIEKYELTNIIKVIIILLILYLAYRLFTSTNEKFNDNNYGNGNDNGNGDVIEGFANITNGTTYGNVISLLNKNNTPNYSNNTCIFQLDGTYRIDTLQFIFNSNANVTPSSTLAAYSSTLPISVQYVDPNNIKHDIKANASIGTLNSGSPITYTTNSTSSYTLKLSSITDQFNKIIFTSQIILTIGDSTNNISTYIDSTGNGYISKFGIFGGSINLPILADYNTNTVTQNLSALTFTSTTPVTTSISSTVNSSVFNFTNNNDQLIYALQFDYSIAKTLASPTTTSSATTTTNAAILPKLTTTVTPFYINITYTNSIYPGQIFAINNVYNVRSDANRLHPDNANTQYIFFNTNEAIIANNISFTVKSVLDNNNYINKITCTNLQALCTIPQTADISTFQQTVNTINGVNDKSTNICPSINELVDTQTKTQQICDNLEYQDKIKSEKIRLQRNQQYLLKLKDQQDQVDQLNQVIQDLEGKRQARAQSADQLRVLQYQKQKSDASTVRDLANQRLESQSNNQLYLDVNVNTI